MGETDFTFQEFGLRAIKNNVAYLAFPGVRG
jgi:hypothetical protein